ncbi:MAG: hypothetical protein QXH42_07145 [Thermoplasmata archaeon]
MRIIIICGNPECRKEYNAETGDREWVCPSCGRVKSNEYWPFLDAKLMQATIDSNTDWKKMYMELIAKARQMVEDKEEELNILRRDLRRCQDQLEAERSSRC